MLLLGAQKFGGQEEGLVQDLLYPTTTWSGLATHLPKATFAQDSVLPEGVFGHWLPVGKDLGSK